MLRHFNALWYSAIWYIIRYAIVYSFDMSQAIALDVLSAMLFAMSLILSIT